MDYSKHEAQQIEIQTPTYQALEKSDLQKLADLKSQMSNFDKQIEDLEIVYGIRQLRAERAIRAKEFTDLLARAAPTMTYGPDKFLEALGEKGDSYREGHLKIIRTGTTTRNVIKEKFIEAYPKLTLQICKIEVGKAEKAIGEDALNKLCSFSTRYSYEFINMKEAME